MKVTNSLPVSLRMNVDSGDVVTYCKWSHLLERTLAQ